MAVSRNQKTREELDDQAAIDTLRTFINVQARDWARRQQNEIQPRVLRLIDEARANGDRPDMVGLIREVYLERQMPQPKLTEGEA